MRTFTFTEGKSSKFWNINLQGRRFTVQFGKIGTTGQTQVKEFADDATARKEHDKLVQEKLKKGYVETTAGAKVLPAEAAQQTMRTPEKTARSSGSKEASSASAGPSVVSTPVTTSVGAGASGKRTFEYSDATSHKFWNIELQGSNLVIQYGRIGSIGQTQLKSFADQAKAQKEYDKLIAEKTGKGYRETTPAAKPVASSLRESLELALVEDPDDLATHMAYADYLSEEGDPLGEFIRVQLALEDPGKSAGERDKLKKQEEELLRKHLPNWLGDLGPYVMGQKGEQDWRTTRVNYTFARGWLHSLEVFNYNVEFTRVMAKAPQLRLLRRLVMVDNRYEQPSEYEEGDDIPEDEDYPQLYPLVRCPFLTNVKTFVVGDMMTPEQEEDAYDGGFSCHTQANGVVGVIKRMPKLEELYLLAHHVDADQLYALKTLTKLRVLMHYHGTNYPLARLAKNSSLENLTHLLLHPHALDDDEAYIRTPGVKAIITSPNLPSLTHVRFRLSDMGDKGVREIVNSGILKRLKMLDLRHGCITDEGARILAGCSEIKHLELLDVGNNCLTNQGIELLRATGVKLLAEGQWEPSGDPWQDREYLYAGDIE